MMLQIKDIENPSFLGPDQNAIALSVRFEDEVEFSPYVARSTDTFGRGAELFERAINGEFGEIAPYVEPVPPAPTSAEVDAERNRRIAAGFTFQSKAYQSRPEDRENMAGASLAALAAMGNGALPGDYRWHGGDSDFVWIAEDNSLTPMDAQTMFAFGQTAMAHKQAHIFAARALKDAEEIPSDYMSDDYWP